MTIIINLRPEIEAQLREKAAQQGRDISLIAAELLTSILEDEAKDEQETIKGIQQGLENFQAGNYRSFNQFAQEQRHKYNLPVDL